MAKCIKCGNKFEIRYRLRSVIAGQFGFELSMLVLGVYGAICISILETVTAILLSFMVGALLFYAVHKLLSRGSMCNKCEENERKA